MDTFNLMGPKAKVDDVLGKVRHQVDEVFVHTEVLKDLNVKVTTEDADELCEDLGVVCKLV